MSKSDCRVRVVCRVRPLNQKEKETSEYVVSFPSSTTVGLGGRCYSYDHVFQPNSSQKEVYSTSAKPLVQDVLSGYNATIFAYGQTASGKTHTMEGVLNDEHLEGIIPRIVTDMFDQLYNMEGNVEVLIKVAYFEIYMEKIRDLLDITKSNLQIGETKLRVPYVKGVTERFVTTPDEILDVVEEGKANRSVAVTNMNAHSSRSHSIFLISIKQENTETHKTIFGKLYLVDLAGSEKVDKTNAQGLTLEEAKTINKSLLALSNVISALSEGKPFIPYRDSKLTRVLQESLGGNARTTLVICCSPSSYNEPETKTTLMFGDRAKSIKNKVEVNVELTAEEWKRRCEKIKESNNKLKSLVESYEGELSLWRSGETVSEDAQRKLMLKDSSQDSIHSTSTTTTPNTSPFATPTKSPSPSHHPDFQEERSKLCGVIEEKEELIQSQCELIQRLTLQLSSIEDEYRANQDECHALKQNMVEITMELDHSQSEVREVMQALEELAVSYDTKDREIEKSISAKHILQEEMDRLQQSVENKSRELHLLQDSTLSEKRRNQERISTLFKDLNDVGSLLGSKLEDRLYKLDSSADLTDEDFTKARIHLSNLRCEVRTLAKQKEVLEGAEKQARDKAQSAMMELGSYKSKITQYESQNESLSTRLSEVEAKKQDLDSTLASLQEELGTLRTRERALESEGEGSYISRETSYVSREGSYVSGGERESSDERTAKHTIEMQRLKQEISSKEEEVVSIKRQHKKQLVTMDTLQRELEDTQQRYSKDKKQFIKIRLQTKVKERLHQDLGGLSDTVSRELERLNAVREQYLHHMSSRLKSKALDGGDSQMEIRSQKEFRFLERNLEELDHAHKKAISDNAEMAREIPRLRSVLASKSKRIGQLEHMVRETQESSCKDYERLHSELEQTKQNCIAKLKEKERENYPKRSRRSSYTYTDRLTGLSHTLPLQDHTHMKRTTDPLTGLVHSKNHPSSRVPRGVDEEVSGSGDGGRGVARRPGGGPIFVRPLPRRNSSDSAGSSREKLMAGAGVALLGQRPKPAHTTTMGNSSGASPTMKLGGSGGRGGVSSYR